MEEYMDIIELKQMKEQIIILNRKLEEKVVVNEDLLRKIVKNKVSGINRYVGIMNSLSLLLIPFMIWACPFLGVSWWFCSVACLFVLTAIVYTNLMHRQLQANDLMNDDLLQVAQKLMKIKYRYFVWSKYSIPFAIVFLCWFFIEMQLTGRGNIISLGLASVCSIWVGYKQYRKIQCKLDDIRTEIEQFMKD